jgi:hypothetical protein
MKRFVVKLTLFLVPLLAGAIYLYVSPYDKELAYGSMNRMCAHRGTWIHDRLFLDPLPADVLFVGTSKLMFSVDDARIEASLRENHDERTHVVNLAYCDQGRNLQYAVLKDTLSVKKVRHIVLGVPAREPRRSHPVFPYIADTEDIFVLPQLGNEHWFRDMFHGLAARLEPLRRSLLFPDPDVSRGAIRAHGYLSIAEVARESELEQEKRKRERRELRREGWDRNPHLSLRYPRHYLEAMARMSREHGAELHFLYMPVYGDPWGKMEGLEIYRQHGEVLIPPREIFDQPANWGDPTHLNASGAELLTDWLAQRLATWE